MKKATKQIAEYINVDLEIRSSQDLQSLADVLSVRLLDLYVGREGQGFLATFENHAGTPGTKTPDGAIQKLVAEIDALPPKEKRLWKSARDRVFDIGVAKTSGSEVFRMTLDSGTVRSVSRLGARIAFSFYQRYNR